MALPTDLAPMWKTFSEIDISAIREEAELTPRLALVGSDDKTSAFQRLLQHGPRSAEQLVTAIPTYHLPLAAADLAALAGYDLRIVLLDDAEQARRDDLRSLLAHPAPLLLVQDPARPVAVSVDPSLGGQVAARVRSDLLPGRSGSCQERAGAGHLAASARPRSRRWARLSRSAPGRSP